MRTTSGISIAVCLGALGLLAAASRGSLANEMEPPSTDDLPVRGIIRSLNQATLATELDARVIRLPLREGQEFKKDDLLVEFECDKYRAELEAAESEHRGHTAARDSTRRLREFNAAGTYEVQLAEAQAGKSAANVEAARIRVNQCRVLAPFSGRITDLLVNEYDMPASHGALMRIVDHRNLEIELIAPSQWLKWLKPGHRFSLAVDETGASIAARVAEVGAVVDAVSQTVKVRGSVDPKDAAGVLPGMSGTAIFEKEGP